MTRFNHWISTGICVAILTVVPLHVRCQEPGNDGGNTDRNIDSEVDSVPRAAFDTVFYLLEPIQATAARERATAPPVATIVVDPAEIRTTPSANPYDLMRRVAGLEVHDQGQGPGFASNVVLRGFTSDHSSDVLLTVDGVPVNLPVHGHVEGYADWNFLFPGAVSSLRVIHGPASPLHGDFSIAGAVELYTRSDSEGMEGSLTATQFGDVSGWVTAGRRSESGGGLVGVDLRRMDGWRENSLVEIGNLLLRGWRRVGDGRLEGGVAVHRGNWGSAGFVSMSDFESGDLDGPADATDGGNQTRVVAHGRYAVPVGDNRHIQVMAWGVASDWDLFLTTPGHVDPFGNLYQAGESDRRWGAGGELEYSWVPSWGELTVGTSIRTDRSEYDRDRTLRRRSVEEELALDAEHTAAGLYFRWRHTVFERLGFDLGGRVDHLRYRSFNRLGLAQASETRVRQWEGGVDLSPSRHVLGEQGPVGEWVSGTRTVVSPKLGARLALADGWTATASSSRGFRSAVGVVGDPDRPPFLAWAHEVGLEHERPGLDLHLALFRVKVTNERIQDPVTLTIGSVGSSVRRGIEADARWSTPWRVTLAGRATITDAQLSGRYADAHHDHADESRIGEYLAFASEEPAGWTVRSDQTIPAEGETAGGQRVPGIARYLARASVSAPIVWDATGRVEWSTTGPYVPIGEADVRTSAYSVLDAGVSVPVGNDFLVDIEARNVFNEVYPEMRSSGYVSPGAPRSFGISIFYGARPSDDGASSF